MAINWSFTLELRANSPTMRTKPLSKKDIIDHILQIMGRNITAHIL